MPQPSEQAWAERAVRDAFMEDVGAARRWQYATVNTGAFNTPERLANVLSDAGRMGWELITVYDKSSNWFQGFEKGFMLLRREVPAGVEPKAWSIQLTGRTRPTPRTCRRRHGQTSDTIVRSPTILTVTTPRRSRAFDGVQQLSGHQAETHTKTPACNPGEGQTDSSS